MPSTLLVKRLHCRSFPKNFHKFFHSSYSVEHPQATAYSWPCLDMYSLFKLILAQSCTSSRNQSFHLYCKRMTEFYMKYNSGLKWVGTNIIFSSQCLIGYINFMLLVWIVQLDDIINTS